MLSSSQIYHKKSETYFVSFETKQKFIESKFDIQT